MEQAIALYINFVKNKQENGILGDIIVENEKSKIKVNDAKDQTGSIPFFTSGQTVLKVNDYLVDGQNIYLNTGGNADVKHYIGKASYSTDTWSIKSNEKLIDYLFLLLFTIKTEINDSYFEGSALKHLQKNNLKNRGIYIPNNNEIDNLHEVLHPLLENISFNERENEKLAKLRDSLLPKLMSGEIDVSKINI